MSGYGPLPDAETEPDARAGYQTVVTRVREGFPGIPSHGGVDREVSTKVIVEVATDVEPAALARVGAPTRGRPTARSRRPETTAPSHTPGRLAPILSLPASNESHRLTRPRSLSCANRQSDCPRPLRQCPQMEIHTLVLQCGAAALRGQEPYRGTGKSQTQERRFRVGPEGRLLQGPT